MSTEHWQGVHTTKAIDDVSWWQPAESLWLDLVTKHSTPSSSVIDVGSGSGMLADELLRLGYSDITSLDISAASLQRLRERLGDQIEYAVGDVRDIQVKRSFDVWFDRAVFHFLTNDADVAAYLDTLMAHTHPGSVAIIATFAEDGPEQCSGLDVHRYAETELAEVFAGAFIPIHSERRIHLTPWQSEQPFNIVVLQRR